jgi:hypothetical protein
MPSCGFSILIFFVEEMLFAMMVLLSFASTIVMSSTFDLCMPHGGVDTFTLIINFLSGTWVPMHVNLGMFEVTKLTT